MVQNLNKHIIGATYANPYQAPFVENEYSQNTPPPDVKGGGGPYVNPYQTVTQHFFDPESPNDPAFSDMQAPNEVDVADPIGQIMSDFKRAQANSAKNSGGMKKQRGAPPTGP